MRHSWAKTEERLMRLGCLLPLCSPATGAGLLFTHSPLSHTLHAQRPPACWEAAQGLHWRWLADPGLPKLHNHELISFPYKLPSVKYFVVATENRLRHSLSFSQFNKQVHKPVFIIGHLTISSVF